MNKILCVYRTNLYYLDCKGALLYIPKYHLIPSIALEVLHLLHHLIEDLSVVLRRIAIGTQAEEDLLIEVGTYLGIVEPVGEGGLYVYQLLNLLSQGLALVVNDD